VTKTVPLKRAPTPCSAISPPTRAFALPWNFSWPRIRARPDFICCALAHWVSMSLDCGAPACKRKLCRPMTADSVALSRSPWAGRVAGSAALPSSAACVFGSQETAIALPYWWRASTSPSKSIRSMP